MTHTAKHTPGPWVVDDDYEDEEQQAIGIVKDGRGYIAGIHILASCNNGEGFNAEDRANAHLIAAAPAMYEALKMARWLSNECECHESWNAPEGNLCGHCTADLAIKTALSQAEGK